MPVLNFEHDFGWLIDCAMAMSEAEIASELGLRHRNKSLLFTVWAPKLKNEPSPLPSKLVTSESSSHDTAQSRSPPPNNDRKPMAPPTNSSATLTAVRSHVLSDANNQETSPRTTSYMPLHEAYKTGNEHEMGRLLEVGGGGAQVTVAGTEAIEIQEQHEQWQKVIYARRGGAGAGGTTKKMFQENTGNGETDIQTCESLKQKRSEWVGMTQHPKSRPVKNPYRQQPNKRKGSEMIEMRHAADANAGGFGVPQQRVKGNLPHGKPQQISVNITANRNRKKKNRNSNSVAYDNGLKFRL